MSDDPNLAAIDCLFCKMATGAIAIDPLLENPHIFAIRDINPRAPIHVLLVPKQHVPDAGALTRAHGPVLGELFAAAAEVARIEGLSEDGYRLAFNVGEAAGMTIPHLHLHLIGGRPLGPEG
jgi:histidine triad (HIT) family protein